MTTRYRLLAGFGFIAALAPAVPAQAQFISAEGSVGTVSAPTVSHSTAVDSLETIGLTAEARDPFGGAPVREDELGRIAGREDISANAESNHTATVSNNSVGDNSRTGEVGIADNAFQNLSGLSVINVNTGNNVGINAAINVNIVMTPQQ